MFNAKKIFYSTQKNFLLVNFVAYFDNKSIELAKDFLSRVKPHQSLKFLTFSRRFQSPETALPNNSAN
ncbi:MAG: hypothetical protein IK062_06890 [Selenomonadaceae bacterium]|nr:hypothetical protein [Selenomonadaceae bacterium]